MNDGLWKAWIGTTTEPTFQWVHTNDSDGSWYHICKMLQIIGQRAAEQQLLLTVVFYPEIKK